MRCVVLTSVVLVVLTAGGGSSAALDADRPGLGLPSAFAGGRARRRPKRARTFPPRARLRAVRSYLRGRAGVVSWALIDSRGRTARVRAAADVRVGEPRQGDAAGGLPAQDRPPMPSLAERAALGPMITASDNDRADAIYYRVGDAALSTGSPGAPGCIFSVAGYWANARLSALDQARFFRRIDRLGAAALARIPPARCCRRSSRGSGGGSRATRSRPGSGTFMKGGWRATGLGQLVHEAALFERGRTRVSMAVLTDGNPSHEYGTATLRGVAQRLFRPGEPARATRRAPARRRGPRPASALRRAGLFDVRRFAPGIAVELVYRGSRNLTGRRLPGYCEDWALMHEPRRAASAVSSGTCAGAGAGS